MQIFIIDAFTKYPFQGNPAATVLVEEFPSDHTMQNIAAEMNLSETAFAKMISPNYYHLRWFTPTSEVNLCGHATLAMAHYLKEINAVDVNSNLKFYTRSGDLAVRFEPHQDSSDLTTSDLVIMNFPACKFEIFAHERSLDLLKSIFNNYNYQILGIAAENIAVLLNCEADVLNFEPDFSQIAQLEGRLIITAPASDRPFDFVSRFFAPQVGINEDPVTGSAHCCLAPYWAERLGKNHLKAKQLSQRTGELELNYLPDLHNLPSGDRLEIKGYAATVLKGLLTI